MMRYQGKITKWVDDKGFGFITQDDNSEQLFVHISGFEKGQERPHIGEVVSYEVAKDLKKGLQAYKVQYVNRPLTQARVNRKTYKPKTGGYSFKWIGVVAFALLGFYLYEKFSHPRFSQTYEQRPIEFSIGGGVSQNFQCVGKTRCTEMVSCDEAKFYLDNCPGTFTDGDGDGIPCEDQLCGH